MATVRQYAWKTLDAIRGGLLHRRGWILFDRLITDRFTLSNLPPPSHLTKKQVLVDAPGITRCVISLRRLAVTSLVVDLNETRSPSKAVLTAAVKAADVDGKWAASAWGKKLARQAARKNLSDFDRYKVMVARTKRKALIAKALA
jgi:large subunit ribosomal protein L14e|tara:strand:+ start:4056 stop:4490 length:435 start_codon:yes stop_codon:yes gene_type:complete